MVNVVSCQIKFQERADDKQNSIERSMLLTVIVMWVNPVSITTSGPLAEHFIGGIETAFAVGRAAQLRVTLHLSQQVLLGLRVSTPKTAQPGDVIRLNLVQRDESGNRIVGGLAVQINVI